MTLDELLAIRGKQALSVEGDKIGTVDEIYADVATGEPEWVSIGAGLFGMKHVLVPVSGLKKENGNVRLDYAREQIKNAPDTGGDEISIDAERRLAEYYGLTYSFSSSPTGMAETPSQPAGGGTPYTEEQSVGRSGNAGDGGYTHTGLRRWQPPIMGSSLGAGTLAGQGVLPSSDPRMRDCIQACLDCYRSCTETVSYCLQTGGRHADYRHISLLLDCAEICRTSADFMLRGSELHPSICGVCSEVCGRCDQSCRQLGDDRQMQACADTCRRCADSCRQMAGMTSGGRI